MIASCRGVLVGLVMASLGCHVFDPKLYLEHGNGGNGADMAVGMPPLHADGGATPGDMAPSMPPRLDTCGHANPTTLCTGSTTFCDGFEQEDGTNFSRWSGNVVGAYGGGIVNPLTTLDVDTNAACLGGRALHTHTVGPKQQAFVYRAFNNGTMPNPLYVRFFFYATALPSKPFQMLGFFEGGGNFDTLFFDPVSNQFTFSTNFSAAVVKANIAALPLRTWVCVEMATTLDLNGSMTLKLNGSAIGSGDNIATQQNGRPFANVNVGLIATDDVEPGTADAYFDEIAMSSAPIGCN